MAARESGPSVGNTWPWGGCGRTCVRAKREANMVGRCRHEVVCVATGEHGRQWGWWGRVGGAAVRLTHKLAGQELAVYHLLFADDGFITAQLPMADRKLLLPLLVYALLLFPMAWQKLRGARTWSTSGM